jgi:hypothetical protein
MFVSAIHLTIAEKTEFARKQVVRWKRRWQDAFAAFVAIECSESKATLHSAIEEVLCDAA